MDGYKSVKKTIEDPSKPTLNEPRGVTKEDVYKTHFRTKQGKFDIHTR